MPIHTRNGATIVSEKVMSMPQRVLRLKQELRRNQASFK